MFQASRLGEWERIKPTPGKQGKRPRGGQPGHQRQLREPLPPERVDEQIEYEINDEEAQRLGRILRPKRNGLLAHFYTLVSQDTREQEFAARRQLFLTEQGYRYDILYDYEIADYQPTLLDLQAEDCRASLQHRTARRFEFKTPKCGSRYSDLGSKILVYRRQNLDP